MARCFEARFTMVGLTTVPIQHTFSLFTVLSRVPVMISYCTVLSMWCYCSDPHYSVVLRSVLTSDYCKILKT